MHLEKVTEDATELEALKIDPHSLTTWTTL